VSHGATWSGASVQPHSGQVLHPNCNCAAQLVQKPADPDGAGNPKTVSSERTGICVGGTIGGAGAALKGGDFGGVAGVRPAELGRATREVSWALGDCETASMAGRHLDAALDGRLADILEALTGRSGVLEALIGRSFKALLGLLEALLGLGGVEALVGRLKTLEPPLGRLPLIRLTLGTTSSSPRSSCKFSRSSHPAAIAALRPELAFCSLGGLLAAAGA